MPSAKCCSAYINFWLKTSWLYVALKSVARGPIPQSFHYGKYKSRLKENYLVVGFPTDATSDTKCMLSRTHYSGAYYDIRLIPTKAASFFPTILPKDLTCCLDAVAACCQFHRRIRPVTWCACGSVLVWRVPFCFRRWSTGGVLLPGQWVALSQLGIGKHQLYANSSSSSSGRHLSISQFRADSELPRITHSTSIHLRRVCMCVGGVGEAMV